MSGREFIDSLALPPNTRAFQKTDLLTLLVEVHRALIKRSVQLDPLAVSPRLANFYSEVETAKDTGDTVGFPGIYYRTTVRAAIDRSNRYRRGEIIQAVLDPTYKPRLQFGTDSGSDQEELELEEEGDY